MSSAPDSLRLRVFGSPGAAPLLLLHPIAVQGDIWSPQWPVLAQKRLVIVPDLPGHGESALLPEGAGVEDYAQAIWRSIDTLGLADIAVAGLSFGGMVAQAMALAQPERVQRLVLAHCGASTSPAVAGLWQERIRAAQADGMQAQVQGTLERWFTPDFRQQAPASCAWVGKMVAAAPLPGYVAAAHAICRLDHRDLLARLHIPALVIGGGQDKAVPLEVSEALAGALPQAEFVAMPEAAHMGNIEQATRFTETLHAFLP